MLLLYYMSKIWEGNGEWECGIFFPKEVEPMWGRGGKGSEDILKGLDVWFELVIDKWIYVLNGWKDRECIIMLVVDIWGLDQLLVWKEEF